VILVGILVLAGFPPYIFLGRKKSYQATGVLITAPLNMFIFRGLVSGRLPSTKLSHITKNNTFKK